VGVRGFVPASHLELAPVGDLQPYAGQELALRVLDVDADRERLVLSRRSLLLKEQRRSMHDVLSSLQPGEVRRGRVASLSDYGAFVDVGGVNGLVHLSELSWQRVRHPSDVVQVGDEVDVKVLDVKVKKRRVSLSIRQLTEDPLGALVPGEIRTGPVTRLVDFGAFVDLSGVEGLVHLSELAEYRVSAPEEIVAPGEEVRVKVLSVDRKRRRVELSIRQAAEYGG
jgi:small subunit ribosomal protein S1